MARAALILLLLILNLFFWGTLVLLLGVVKFFLPAGRMRRRLVLTIAALAERWVKGNNEIFSILLPIEWDIEGGEDLRRDGHYLIFANHVSWADIFVVFRALHRRVVFIRFFVKQELAWVPVVGQACWALEFPFMKRYTADDLARHPEKRGRDLETTRRACARYRDIPVAILNFLEGTRFSREKHAEQESPYRYLLRPRTGGAHFVLASLGDQLDAVVDLTIAYPGHTITIWDFLSGRVGRVHVHVRQLQIPSDAASYESFKCWIDEIWTAKDRRLYDWFANDRERNRQT